MSAQSVVSETGLARQAPQHLRTADALVARDVGQEEDGGAALGNRGDAVHAELQRF